ncbi:hypothetical protein [Rahnella contaminans]|uniref:BigA/YdbA N-terminal beta-barrel domain-containing protein n=1 Tax=Rahnella contaminans TaxID=2703882 RepID=UPI003C2C8337
MNMQKKVLSLCIALALGNNAFAAPEVESKSKIEDKTCPAKGTVLTKEQKAKLPKKCLSDDDDKMLWGWIAGGSVVAGILALAGGGGGGGGGDDHHSDPIPDPTPDPIPDPIPDPTPDPEPTTGTVTYRNNAVLDKTEKTITFNDVTYSYAPDGDRYVLTAPDGSVLYTESDKWLVDDRNDLILRGDDTEGYYWIYDSEAKFVREDAHTNLIEGDGTNNKIENGSSSSGEYSAGTIVDGNNTNTVIDGGSSATDGGKGTYINGDGSVVDNTGGTSASGDHATGIDITGNNDKVINGGESTATNGGTGTNIDGNNAQVDNKGEATVSGDGSTGTKIKGDDAVINNSGKTDVTEGGTGSKIDGNGADVINSGDTTASGTGSTGTDITGDGAVVDNSGKTDIKDGGTGTIIDGKDAKVDNKGETTVSGEDSTGTKIKDDDAVINNSGKTDVTEGGTGTKIDGNGADVINSGDTTASGTGSTGTDITGDGAVVDNSGKTDVTDGGTGTKIDGNGADVINTGDTTASGTGSTGTDITGDGAVVDNSGKTDVTDGGTGTNIDGKDAQVDNKGETTVSGDGSTGITIKGDDATINNSGKTDVTDGGTGTKIDGNGADVINTGDTTASGTGSTGTDITGDNAKVIDQGSTTVTDNATGTKIDGNGADVTIKGDGTNPATIDVSGGGKAVVINGDDAKITIEDATANVDGAGSSVATITGDNATANIGGDYYVKGGAHGIDIAGDNSTVNTTARFFVQDLESIGVKITATNDGAEEKTTFTSAGDINVTNDATGVSISGDKAEVNLNGDINVTSMKHENKWGDPGGEVSGGTGLLVKGNNTNTTLNGNLTLSTDIPDSDSAYAFNTKALLGLDVRGSDNTVDINGSVKLEQIGYTKGSNNVAIRVTGEGNAVTVSEGIQLDLDTTPKYRNDDIGIVGVDVTGNSSVTVSGHSTVTNNASLTEATKLIYAKNGGQALLTTDSVVDFISTSPARGAVQKFGFLTAQNANSKIENAGVINASTTGGAIMDADKGGNVLNSGTINWTSDKTGNAQRGSVLNANNADAKATNTGNINLKNYVSPTGGGGEARFPLLYIDGVMYGELASGTGSFVENEGSITLQGAGLFGAGASQKNTLATNSGTITLDGFGPSTDAEGNNIDKTVYTTADNTAYYRGAGMIAGSTNTGTSSNAQAINTGDITVNNSGFGMLALNGGTVTNQGNITLTADVATVSDGKQTQLVGMGAMSGGTAINGTSGVININTDLGRAFYTDGASGSQIVNKGTVNYMGSGIDNGDVHMGSTPQSVVAGAPALLKGYRVGTNADGSSGKFYGSNVDVSDVTVDTGFTEGTAAKTTTINDAFVGSDIAGAENIQSDSVVWNAEGKTDASGNVDVTMTKKAYTDVVTDSSVNGVAGALEAGYTNNALYQSLNLKTAKDVTNAMKQISGSKATTAFNEAKVLSNRFTMLADNAVVNSNGLGFNVVAKGDKRAELGNNTQYDMMALSQKLSLTDNQTLKLQYGIARLDGNGEVKSAGDNGLTGGYSQFFGLEHEMDLGNNLSWDNALRYDNHQLNSSRSIQYGSVNEVANANNSQQYMEMKSQFSKGYDLSEALKFKPSIGAKVRHTRDGSVNETGANDYNLKMDAGSETAVDAIAGMELTYAGKNGWAATASVEGGPNLSYSKSARSASLQGAAGQHFNVDDGQKGGGVNSLSQVGVSYSQGNTSLGMDAYNWKEDGASDKGLNLNLKVKF